MYLVYYPLDISKDINREVAKLLLILLKLGQLEVVREYCKNNLGWSFKKLNDETNCESKD